MTKIAIIIDKSQSYLDLQRDNVLKSWEPEETQHVKSFAEVGEATIFGDPPTSIMSITELSALKKLLADMLLIQKEGKLESRLEYGLVITTTIARVSTKKLEALIEEIGGTVVFAKVNAKDKTSVTQKMLNETSLNNEVKKFLTEYIRDDYDVLISIVRSISTLHPKQQVRLTVDDIFIRLPQAPGSIPPWEIEKPLMAGDSKQTIELYRRITKHAHQLVVLSILKNKFQLSWRIASLLSISPRMTLSDVAEALSIPNNYPTKLAFESARKVGLDKMTDCLTMLADTERKLKGGSSADGNVIMEIALINIVSRIRR